METARTISHANVELWRFPLAAATGGSGVTSVDIVVVDLESNDGVKGTGFSYVLGSGIGEVVCAATSQLLTRFVAGQPLIPPPALWRRLVESLNRTGRGLSLLGITAIDVAAWDLWAKLRDEPLCLALGGAPRKVPVYGSGGFGPQQAPEKAAEHALNYAGQGYSAVKLRLSGEVSDLERLRAVRDALPPNVHMMADVNEKCDLDKALWLARACAEFGLLWLEEPLPSGNIQGYATLAAASPVAIATGEHLQGAVELAPFLKDCSCAVVQPDLAMMGGITECLRVATIAEYYGLVVAPHFLPSLFVSLAAAAPGVRWLEHFPLLEPLFSNPVEPAADGTLLPPLVPGHGLDWANGARSEFRVSV